MSNGLCYFNALDGFFAKQKGCLVSFFTFMPSGFCFFNALDMSFSNRRGVWLVVLPLCRVDSATSML